MTFEPQPELAEPGRINKRMRAQRYPHDDKLQLLVLQAFDVMQELRMHCHYLGCSGAGGSGATEPPKFGGVPLPTRLHNEPQHDTDMLPND